MTTDKVNPVGTKDEPFRRALNRPYYYGYARTGKTVYAYTKQEWGMGAGSGGGMVFFGLIFGLGVLQGYLNVQEEWRGRKARKLKGLPKPWWQAADDHAYEWFLTHPDSRIQMTLDYFPHSAKLRRQEAAR